MEQDARNALKAAADSLQHVLNQQLLNDLRTAHVTPNYTTGNLEVDIRPTGVPALPRGVSESVGAAGGAGTPWGGVEPGRCVARARSGARCGQPVVRGAVVCRFHGGSAPQVKAAARRRVETQTALQWAKRELERLGVEDRTPLEHLEASLVAAAYDYRVWSLACETLVQEGRSSLMGRDRHGQQTIHPYVSERDQALAQWARISKFALDAGVAERRVRILQQQGELMIGAAQAMMAHLQAQYGLQPAAAAEGLKVLGEQLRRLGPGTIDGVAHTKH